MSDALDILAGISNSELAQSIKDLQRRTRLLEEQAGKPDFWTREQLEKMIDDPEMVAEKITGPETWSGLDGDAQDVTTRLVKALARHLIDAPPGSKVGFHNAGGQPTIWIREPSE